MRFFLVSASAVILTACGGTTDTTPADAGTAPTPPANSAPSATSPMPPAEAMLDLGSTGTYTLDPGHTSVIWKVKHLGVSNYTARFTDVDATLEFNPENTGLTGLSVTIDPKSVAANYVGDYKATHADSGFDTWDEDLALSEKWFNANQHTAITFTATSITKGGTNRGQVTGDLTFLGVTKPVTLDVKYNGTVTMRGQERIGFSATGKLDRTDFGMDANVPFIAPEVDLVIEAEFVKDAA